MTGFNAATVRAVFYVLMRHSAGILVEGRVAQHITDEGEWDRQKIIAEPSPFGMTYTVESGPFVDAASQ